MYEHSGGYDTGQAAVRARDAYELIRSFNQGIHGEDGDDPGAILAVDATDELVYQALRDELATELANYDRVSEYDLEATFTDATELERFEYDPEGFLHNHSHGLTADTSFDTVTLMLQDLAARDERYDDPAEAAIDMVETMLAFWAPGEPGDDW